MAPLHPSANIHYVGTQKDIYGLRVAQNTIDGLIMNYISHPSNWLFLPFKYVKSCTRLFLYATHVLYTSVYYYISHTDLYVGYR